MVKNIVDIDMSLGFIIPRKITNDTSNQYWKECCHCIRLFYPESPILIIDDNSLPKYVQEENLFTNCKIIFNKEFPGSGELSAYYYFHKLHPFEKAVIVHDSVFFQKYIDFTTVRDVKLLWSFNMSCSLKETPFYNFFCFSTVPYCKLRCFKNIQNYHGCFGVMSVITWTFLNTLEKNTGLLSSMIPHITSRKDRECVERIFGFFCYLLKPSLSKDDSFFGNIHSYCRWGITWEEYKTGEGKNLPVTKIWTGR